jgi:hypothetical protein
MRTWTRSTLLAVVALLAVGALACNGHTERTDTGGVALQIQTFNGLPVQQSVNTGGGFVQVGTLTLRSIILGPDIAPGETSDINITTYQVTYRRLDGNGPNPPPFVNHVFGNVPVGGTTTFNNLPLMGPDQILVRPVSDLLNENGGFIRETGNNYIPMEFQLTFFGKTISGRDVASNTVAFTITLTQ